jgi:iron(III) transport system permease protein
MPLMLGGIGGALMLPFVTVTSELSSTMVLYSGPWTTTVAMLQALEDNSRASPRQRPPC